MDQSHRLVDSDVEQKKSPPHDKCRGERGVTPSPSPTSLAHTAPRLLDRGSHLGAAYGRSHVSARPAQHLTALPWTPKYFGISIIALEPDGILSPPGHPDQQAPADA